MRAIRNILFSLTLAAFAPHTTASPLEGRRPNIIFIITDDQGYGDMSCHGNPVLRTPRIDRLHRQSVRFEDFQVSPTCSPTRAALMTGRHEFRSGVSHTIFERERMDLRSVTIASTLKDAGYTTGIFGKWHLGDEDPYQPDKRGFDEVFIHGGGGIGQTFPGSCGDAPGNTYFDPAIKHNGRFVKTRGYCTDVFFRQAMEWIGTRKDSAPFFAWIATNAPHEPLQVPEEYEGKYRGKVGADEARFFGMIANIDDNVGRLLDKLDEWGIARDTLVIMMGDNGGKTAVRIHNAGMRGAKGSAWRGGIRTFSFWRWPGTLEPAAVSALAAHIDVFPTLAALAGAKPDPTVTAGLEGRSLLPLLQDSSAPWPDRTLFTHVGRWEKGARPVKYGICSVRNNRHSLVRVGDGWHLFDLGTDPGQSRDLAASHPEIVRRLSTAYDKWWEQTLPFADVPVSEGPKVNPFKEQYRRQMGQAE